MRYVLRKVALFVITLWAAITLNFALPRLMPGSPVDAALARIASSGQQITNAQRHAIEVQLGVPNSNVFSQYGEYWKNIFTLDFGRSYSFPTQTVTQTIGHALTWTLVLIGSTTIIAFIIGTLLGVYAGWRRGTAADTSVTISATFFAAFPPSWLGLLLLYLLAFRFGIFPIKGGYNEGASPWFNWPFIRDAIVHSVLPAATLAFTTLSGWV